MNRAEIEAFVVGWIDAWNRRDIDAVPAHFADGVTFHEPGGGDSPMSYNDGELTRW